MKRLLLALLVLGMAVRLCVFFQNRSLFLDEANLARNIVEKPVPQFFKPLDYEQYAPPFFLIFEKAATSALGNTEQALRLFPLLMGCLVLLFFYLILLKQFGTPVWVWFPLFLLAFSPDLIRYSTEVKQYMVDTGVGVWLLWLTWKFPPHKWQKQTALGWALLGGFCMWLAMPSVFLLFGIGLFYLFSFYRIRQFKKVWSTGLVIICWLVSFGFFYWQILKPGLATDLLVDYHQTHFFPLFPTTTAEWQKAGNILLGLFRIPFGFTTLAYTIGIVTFLLGIYHLFKKNVAQFFLLAMPIASCLVASGLGYYSLMPRLGLFLVPSLVLICSFGIERVWQLDLGLKRPWVAFAGLLVFTVIAFAHDGYRFFYQPLKVEEIKPLMQQIKNHDQTVDLIYVHHEAAPAFIFYKKYHRHPITFPQSRVHIAKWDQSPEAYFMSKQPPAHFWMVFSHLLSQHAQNMRDDNLSTIPQFYTLVEKLETEGAEAYLFVRK